MRDELPTCEYVGDKIGDEEGTVTDCPNEAHFVMRGQRGQAMHISRQKGRVLACQKHGSYLKRDAKLSWEIIGSGEEDVQRIVEQREDHDPVEPDLSDGVFGSHLPDLPEELEDSSSNSTEDDSGE